MTEEAWNSRTATHLTLLRQPLADLGELVHIRRTVRTPNGSLLHEKRWWKSRNVLEKKMEKFGHW